MNVPSALQCTSASSSINGSCRCGGSSVSAYKPILLTYLTNPHEQWVLGITAALHGMPLALIGEGHKWVSSSARLRHVRQAVAHIHALSPTSPVIITDGSDTLVANGLTRATATLLRGLVERDEVLFGSECASFPMCYKADYTGKGAAQAQHQKCRARSKTCFLNGGTYAGSSSALLRLLEHTDHLAGSVLSGAELNDDQAAAHRILLSNAMPLKVDDRGSIFLTLRPCRGPEMRVIPSPVKGAPKGTTLTVCHYREHVHNPSKRVSRNGSRMVYLDFENATQLPLVVHANGFHKRLSQGPISPPYLANLYQRPTLLEHPILLLNSKRNGTCSHDTLGNVLKRAKIDRALRILEMRKIAYAWKQRKKQASLTGSRASLGGTVRKHAG